ncbi:hypothetical protein AB0A70_00675 [Streptomyces morookaense]|uniref:hypothetical protein n=1 Tax=Streptomyces morookaense TaxID=1970 RepID=UPI0033FDD4E3
MTETGPPPIPGIPTTNGQTKPPWVDKPPCVPPWWIYQNDQLRAITCSVKQDLALITSIPVEAQKQQLAERLGLLQANGLLTSVEVAMLMSTVNGEPHGASAMTPSIITPDGSPSLCGFIGSAVRHSHGLRVEQDWGRDAVVGLAAAGGAAIGGMVADGGGAVVGAAIGGALASHYTREE